VLSELGRPVLRVPRWLPYGRGLRRGEPLRGQLDPRHRGVRVRPRGLPGL